MFVEWLWLRCLIICGVCCGERIGLSVMMI